VFFDRLPWLDDSAREACEGRKLATGEEELGEGGREGGREGRGEGERVCVFRLSGLD